MTKTLFAAALALALVPVAAHADAHEPVQVRVDVSDLDLSRPEGRERADLRVASAIRSLCDSGSDRSLTARQAETACRAEAQASVRLPSM